MFEQIALTNYLGLLSSPYTCSTTAIHNAVAYIVVESKCDDSLNDSANPIISLLTSKEQSILTVSSYMRCMEEDANIKSHDINFRKYLSKEDHKLHRRNI